MSRYDYRDPGTDPTYCDRLAPEPELGYVCVYCGQWFEGTDDDPYCSALCGRYAMMDDEEFESFPRRLTRQEHLQGLADRGCDTWEDYRGEK